MDDRTTIAAMVLQGLMPKYKQVDDDILIQKAVSMTDDLIKLVKLTESGSSPVFIDESTGKIKID